MVKKIEILVFYIFMYLYSKVSKIRKILDVKYFVNRKIQLICRFIFLTKTVVVVNSRVSASCTCYPLLMTIRYLIASYKCCSSATLGL